MDPYQKRIVKNKIKVLEHAKKIRKRFPDLQIFWNIKTNLL